jgi:hypothetical protein
MDVLLREFQAFLWKHPTIGKQKADYAEAFPHPPLTTFLLRVLNDGGHLEREAAAGRRNLAVEYKKNWYIIETKLIHSWNSPEGIKEEGLRQIGRCRDTINPRKERITWAEENTVQVLGCWGDRP